MIIDGIGQGLMWACLTIGVFITFRILDIPDLTTEGSFPLGAAVTIKLMLSGQSAVVAMGCGFIAGFLAGMVTGLLDTKLHIPSLLAGILTMTGLYSVNMHIMGKANIPLLNQKVLTNYLPEAWDVTVQTIVIGAIICTIVVALLVLFFKTQSGLALRATGNNVTMSASNGIKTQRTIILGYAISNGLIAMSGSLIAQSNGFADIGMGIGTIVIGLASVLVGEIILPAKKMVWRLTAMVLGAIIYRVLLTLAMNVGVSPDDLKILSAIILVIVIVVPMIQNQYRSQQQLKRYLQKLNLNSEVKLDE